MLYVLTLIVPIRSLVGFFSLDELKFSLLLDSLLLLLLDGFTVITLTFLSSDVLHVLLSLDDIVNRVDVLWLVSRFHFIFGLFLFILDHV